MTPRRKYDLCRRHLDNPISEVADYALETLAQSDDPADIREVSRRRNLMWSGPHSEAALPQFRCADAHPLGVNAENYATMNAPLSLIDALKGASPFIAGTLVVIALLAIATIAAATTIEAVKAQSMEERF